MNNLIFEKHRQDAMFLLQQSNIAWKNMWLVLCISIILTMVLNPAAFQSRFFIGGLFIYTVCVLLSTYPLRKNSSLENIITIWYFRFICEMLLMFLIITYTGREKDFLTQKNIENQLLIKELQLEKKLHLSEKFVTIGQLAAGLAHEIRNPLTAVQGFVQLLKNRQLGKKEQEYLLSKALPTAEACLPLSCRRQHQLTTATGKVFHTAVHQLNLSAKALVIKTAAYRTKTNFCIELRDIIKAIADTYPVP